MASKAEETKKVAKKTAAKTVKKETIAKVVEEKKPAAKNSVQSEGAISVSKKAEEKFAAISVDVVGIDGKGAGKISLPGEIFGEKINKALLAQAIRVYLANQRQGNASTKTRGEVEGSTRKIYRQKGTGRARHGGVRAPIFVKGGIVFGPKPRDFGLSLPQKMKRKALFSALSAKVKDNEIMFVDGIAKMEAKTKNFSGMLKNLGLAEKKQKVLVITTTGNVESVLRAGRNVQGIHFLPSKLMNPYEVLVAKRIIVMKDAVDEMKEHFLKK